MSHDIADDEEFRSTDQLDTASRIERMENQENVRRARDLSKPEQVKGEDGNWPILDCVDCGEELIPARLELARIRCVECQTLKEKRNGR